MTLVPRPCDIFRVTENGAGLGTRLHKMHVFKYFLPFSASFYPHYITTPIHSTFCFVFLSSLSPERPSLWSWVSPPPLLVPPSPSSPPLSLPLRQGRLPRQAPWAARPAAAPEEARSLPRAAGSQQHSLGSPPGEETGVQHATLLNVLLKDTPEIRTPL